MEFFDGHSVGAKILLQTGQNDRYSFVEMQDFRDELEDYQYPFSFASVATQITFSSVLSNESGESIE